MTLPRSSQIDPEFTPYYHCVSRCVRRAYLCGVDEKTGFDFSHRRDWIETRLMMLAEIFAIDVCAYAVMSNHYHVVVRINAIQQSAWPAEEVIERWSRLHRVPEHLQDLDAGGQQELISRWRARLGSISWFMKSLNEPLARIANKEDGCKGRFWEGRFRSQALLDEVSLLKCMAYVDLNPIRADLADTPETSAHTSIQARIQRRDQSLAPMTDDALIGCQKPLPIKWLDYLELVDWTGRQLRPGKRGRIDRQQPEIVARLHSFSLGDWRQEMRHLSRRYCRAIGSISSLRDFRDHLGQQRLRGVTG